MSGCHTKHLSGEVELDATLLTGLRCLLQSAATVALAVAVAEAEAKAVTNAI